MADERKRLLVIYHSQGGTMKTLVDHLVRGARREESITVIAKHATAATTSDLLHCDGITICSPEYFGTMAGLIKDFFDRTFEPARELTVGLPYVIVVCAGNDGRGAITQIERLAAGYRWKQVQEHRRVVGPATPETLADLEELGHTLAAGIAFGIF